MQRTIGLFASLMLLVGSLGCVAAPVVPPIGLIYSNVDAPITLGPSDTAGRRGEASVKAWFGLVSTGDGSVKAAADNGGITDVKRVDYEFKNVLFFYQRYTTVVHGN
jgi:hypothetical protein